MADKGFRILSLVAKKPLGLKSLVAGNEVAAAAATTSSGFAAKPFCWLELMPEGHVARRSRAVARQQRKLPLSDSFLCRKINDENKAT